MLEISSTISRYSSCTSGALRSPSPWYVASTRIASSCLSRDTSHRGLSGIVQHSPSTNPANTICTQTGIRQLIVPSIMLVRQGMNVPGMPPANHSTLYSPVREPRQDGCAISET